MSSPRGEQEPIRRESGVVSAALVVSAAPIAVAVESARAQAYADASRSKHTRRAYKNDWQGFADWCEARDVDPLEARAPAVAGYLAWLADNGYAASSIDRAAAGIAWHLRRINPSEWPRRPMPEPIALVLAGIRRTLLYRPHAKKAIMLAELRAMLPHLGAGLYGPRNRALALTAFFGAMRRSELIALDVADTSMDRQGMILRTRKGSSVLERGLRHQEDAAICAPCAVHSWMKQGHIDTGPLFRSILGGIATVRRVHENALGDALQSAARKVGLDPLRFAAHSLRAGFVLTAAQDGKSIDAIMRQTGHKSVEYVKEYIDARVLDMSTTENLK